MDSQPYVVEAATSRAPLERSVSADLNQPIFFASSTSIEQVDMLKRWNTPVAVGRGNLIVFGFGAGAPVFSENTIDKLELTHRKVLTSILRNEVAPVADELLRPVRERVETVYNVDAAAVLDAEQSRVALRVVVDVVEDFIKAGDFWSLNETLSMVDPSKLRKITNVAFLRSSFRVRDKLSNWVTLYNRTWMHLLDTDQDPAHALRGLARTKVAKLA
ncbi:MAG: hypothetical protein U1C13_28745 [Pseudomonas sp.]|nr:hypothetical protein [Pseudomonas sp.]